MKPAIKFNTASAKSWNYWLKVYTIIGVVILLLAIAVNGFIIIAEAIIAYPITKILIGKRECDINNGKVIDKLEKVGRINMTQ